MGRKKTYGIFNKGAQKGEKSSKNIAETVSVDTLYIVYPLKDLFYQTLFNPMFTKIENTPDQPLI